jgi:hypothetical protein
VPSHIQFLGAVACHAGSVIQAHHKRGAYKGNHHFQAVAPDFALGLENGLNVVLDHFFSHFSKGPKGLSETQEAQKAEEPEHWLQIKRKSKGDSVMPEIRVTSRGKTLTVFPKSKSGETQEITIRLNGADPARNLESICVTSGLNSASPVSKDLDLGAFEFKLLGFPFQWEVWRNSDGKPVGQTMNTYSIQK